MFTIVVKDKDGGQMVFTTQKRTLARAVKLLAAENEYQCDVAVIQQRTVKFKGIE